MRRPTELWRALAEDERWLDRQEDVIAEIMREAFAAGFAAGTDVAGDAIRGHAAGMHGNLAVRQTKETMLGLIERARIVEQVGADRGALDRAWNEAVRRGPA